MKFFRYRTAKDGHFNKRILLVITVMEKYLIGSDVEF